MSPKCDIRLIERLNKASSMPFDWVGFDADDTLWHDIPKYLDVEARFTDLLSHYHDRNWISERFNAVNIHNLQYFGYGLKGFVLSMIESAIELTEGRVNGREIAQIIEWGKEIKRSPLELMEGIEWVLDDLGTDFQLALITKGDLFDQEVKIAGSGLADYFDAVEVFSSKTVENYRQFFDRRGIVAERFVMIGNSIASDIVPVVNAGGCGIYIPYEKTWSHEMDELPRERCVSVPHTKKLPAVIRQWSRP